MLDLASRFSFGMNLDDAWRYAGLREPKSIVLPHLLSLSLPEGSTSARVDDAEIRRHQEPEPATAAARATLALAESLRDARADYVRCWFPWRFFESTPVPEADLDSLLESSYSSWPTDYLVDTLASHGIGLLPVVGCGYSRMLPEGLNAEKYEDYLKRIVVHTRLLVRHYRGRIRHWQIENEPDWWEMHVAGGWRSGAIWIDPKEFRPMLLRALNGAVHEEDESAVTVVNLEADSEKLDVREYSAFSDVIGLDFYPNYKSAYPIDLKVFGRAQEASRLVGSRVLIMETGYPSGPALLGYSQERQADYVRKAITVAHSMDGVGGVGIWRYADSAWHSFPPQENHFGLFDSKGGAKLSWKAFAETVGELKG